MPKKVPSPKGKKTKNLQAGLAKQVLSPEQLVFEWEIDAEGTPHGIEMGVLANGMAFLTQGGLAAMCGVSPRAIRKLDHEWERAHAQKVQGRSRIDKIRKHLKSLEYDREQLYFAIKTEDSPHYAYPDVVCMTILEYFAFDSRRKNLQAQNAFRRIAGFGFRKFVYESLEYVRVDPWQHVKDRMTQVQLAVPSGYFGVFHEVGGLLLHLIARGLPVNSSTVPDISIGMAWSKHWNACKLAGRFGERTKYSHSYPSYFPQADSNPQEVWAYPLDALGTFRKWFNSIYLPMQFPAYILRKAKELSGGVDQAMRIAEEFRIENGDD